VGTVNPYNFNYFDIIVNGAPTGKYYVGQSWVREWNLLDYYYYSNYNVQLNGSLVPNQEYFYNSSEVYSDDSSFVCDSEFVDVVMYDACLLSLTDAEDTKVVGEIKERRDLAWDKLLTIYPSMKPIIITQKYNFSTDYGVDGPGRLNY
jgi:hypothetical protein